jgi:hypothetical protein
MSKVPGISLKYCNSSEPNAIIGTILIKTWYNFLLGSFDQIESMINRYENSQRAAGKL